MDFQFPNKKRSGSTKYKSVRQEKKVAKEFDGKVTPNSGATAIKGDVSTDDFHIECKTTAKTQYILKLTMLEVLAHEAYVEGKIPLLIVDLADEAKGLDRSWVVLPKQAFLEMRKTLNGDE